MNISKGYFRHPVTGEMIWPGELYTFDVKGENKAQDVKKEPYENKEQADSLPYGHMTAAELKDVAKRLGITVKKANKKELLEEIKRWQIKEGTLNG